MTNNDNIYGFDTTDNVKLDLQGLPLGIHKVMIVGEEADPQDRGLIVEYEVVEGERKGKKSKVWYLTKHSNATTANIAKQEIKRIADATAKAVSPATPLKGRVLVVEVVTQKNDESRSQIKKYYPESYKPEAPTPF